VKLAKWCGAIRPELFLFFPILFLVFPEFFPNLMKLTAEQARRLLQEVAHKSGHLLEYANRDNIADAIGKDVPGDYIYKLYRRVVNAQDEDLIGVHQHHVNAMLQHLGFKSISEWLNTIQEDPVLSALKGNYYCYVRRNSEDTVVLRSPVRISKNGGQYFFELRGPSWTYKGVMTSSDGSVFVLMRSESGKQIHHVYRIGKARRPKVLQGIFSGVSTTFEPIGGRVVLAAVDEPFEKLKNKELRPVDLKKDKGLGARLARYFEKYEKNNLRINPPMGFNDGDL
jgi:hypothetical protein